jgi:hypothetical protein
MAQVSLAKDGDMVMTFLPDRANQPFRMTILPWQLWRGWPAANAHSAEPLGKNLP